MIPESAEPDLVIHPAKLPIRLPSELLHVRPDADGVVYGAEVDARKLMRYEKK